MRPGRTVTTVKTDETMKSNCDTPFGDLEINTLGHAGLLLRVDGRNIYADPYSEVCDFSGMPKADLVLITHDHYDHYDPAALRYIVKPGTSYIGNMACRELFDDVTCLKNGEMTSWRGMKIKAVPAYNTTGMRAPGEPFHPKGEGNGYVLCLDDFKIYIAGDTELTDEMRALTGMDIAFLPKNLPYTMSDAMFVEAARAINPRILYPYHYFEIDKKALEMELPGIELRL